MRKLLILFLFISATLSGQVLKTYPNYTPNPIVITGAAEMVTNGAIGDGTSWFLVQDAPNGTASFTDNHVLFSYDGVGYPNLRVGQYEADMVSPVLISTAYEIIFDLTISSGSAWITIQGSDGQQYFAEAEHTTSGTKTIQFTSPGTLNTGGIRISVTMGLGSVTIDNISLKLQE